MYASSPQNRILARPGAESAAERGAISTNKRVSHAPRGAPCQGKHHQLNEFLPGRLWGALGLGEKVTGR
jgi:hypothetical protein